MIVRTLLGGIFRDIGILGFIKERDLLCQEDFDVLDIFTFSNKVSVSDAADNNSHRPIRMNSSRVTPKE